MKILSAIKEVLLEGKAEELVVLPTQEQSGGLFSHVVIVTAGSGRHAAGLAERTLKVVKACGLKKPTIETSEERLWVLIDCGDIIVHIMQEEARKHYQLESLWSFETGTTMGVINE